METVRYTAALTERQVEALRALSARTRISIAAFLREAVDDVLAKHGEKSEAQAARTARASGSTTTPPSKRKRS